MTNFKFFKDGVEIEDDCYYIDPEDSSVWQWSPSAMREYDGVTFKISTGAVDSNDKKVFLGDSITYDDDSGDGMTVGFGIVGGYYDLFEDTLGDMIVANSKFDKLVRLVGVEKAKQIQEMYDD